MENKILDFQFEHVCAKQTRPNYSLEATKMKQKSSMTDGVHIEAATRGVL